MRCWLCILWLFLISCGSETSTERVSHFSGVEMTIPYSIIIGGRLSNKDTQSVFQVIHSTFAEVNDIYNKWNPKSELSRLNDLKAGVRVPLSPQLEHLLSLTNHIVELSDGRFDPTIDPLQKLWADKFILGEEPSPAEIQKIVPAIGWNKIHFANGIFYKDNDLTRLDLGGIAKGYCVDLLVERLNKTGFANVFVEWGGEIRASGQHPDNRPWKVFISRLGDTDPNQAIATLSLKDQAIATSGDYLQNWTIQRVGTGEVITYFHIIDPRSYHPLVMTPESVASASVLAPTCALADGLATAAMLFPSLEQAQAWADTLTQKEPDLRFWLISRVE